MNNFQNRDEWYDFSEKGAKVIRPGSLQMTEAIIEKCSLPEAAHVIDVGCGVGTTVQYLRSKYGYRSTGIDYSEKLIQKGLETVPNISVQVGNAEQLPYKSGEADCVMMECSLSTMQNPQRVLDEAHRVLALGGKLGISDVFCKDDEVILKSNKKVGEACLFKAMTKQQLVDMLKYRGFAICSWEDKTAAWLSYIAQMVWNNYGMENLGCQAAWCALRESKKSGERLGYFCLVAEKTTQRCGDER